MVSRYWLVTIFLFFFSVSSICVLFVVWVGLVCWWQNRHGGSYWEGIEAVPWTPWAHRRIQQLYSPRTQNTPSSRYDEHHHGGAGPTVYAGLTRRQRQTAGRTGVPFRAWERDSLSLAMRRPFDSRRKTNTDLQTQIPAQHNDKWIISFFFFSFHTITFSTFGTHTSCNFFCLFSFLYWNMFIWTWHG